MRRLENKRKKKKKGGRVKQRRDRKDLNIYSPGGKLLHKVKRGFRLDYQKLLRQKNQRE